VINSFKYQHEGNWARIFNWLQTRKQDHDQLEKQVQQIIDEVKAYGDQALVDYTQKFDCPSFKLGFLAVTPEEINLSLEQVDPKDLNIIQEAKENIFAYHQKQVQNSWFSTRADGTIVGQIVRPVQRAGLYVPGGQGGETPLISSLLMNAIPAIVAGVKEIILVSPPRQDGSLNPYLLATAHLLGLDKIFKVGSAWAIAALALGTQTIPAVDVIAGPGNIFVTLAKKLLQSQVGIDMIAGPSEITILACKQANPKYIAADLLSQAEHDPLAASILISPSPILIQAVKDELKHQLTTLHRSEIAQKSLQNHGAVIEVPSVETGIELVNKIAPEHFELMVENPWELLGKIQNAGAIFIGEYTPEPVGDYFAGPNHVLPTMSTARFSSALSVETFYHKSSLIYTNQEYLKQNGPKIARLARLENLEAHARSIETRINDD